jgi:hypothetical protein
MCFLRGGGETANGSGHRLDGVILFVEDVLHAVDADLRVVVLQADLFLGDVDVHRSNTRERVQRIGTVVTAIAD